MARDTHSENARYRIRACSYPQKHRDHRRKVKASFGLVLAQPLSSGQNVTATAAVPGGNNASKFSASRTAEANKK